MINQKVVVDQGDQFFPSYLVPIPHFTLGETTIGNAETIFTAPRLFEVARLVVSNISGSAVALNLYSVPSAGSAAGTNAELVGFSVAANTAVDLTDLIGGLYEGGTTLEGFAGTADVLILHGYGRAYQ